MITPGEGVVVAQRYTLVRVLASGGMGSVWIAHYHELEIDVSVKFMAPTLVQAAEARMRFEREAKVAARLRSKHIVRVLAYGVEDGTPYIVMELLKGETLAERLARDGRLAMPVAAPLVVQICKALRTAHEAGLVHRDLKPANLFLAIEDEEEVVKVLDFGIAKTAGVGGAQTDTASGMLLGSVHYMSPEQVRSSRQVDYRSDLWAVGVILYRVLTGRLPFPGTDIGDVLVRVCTDFVPPPSSAAPDLPPQADEFFSRALARDPDQRFQSAMELSEAFSVMALETSASPPATTHARRMLNQAHLLDGSASPEVTAARKVATEALKGAWAPSEPAPEESAAAPLSQRPRQALLSAADDLTVAIPPSTEATVGTIPAVQVPGPRVELSKRAFQVPSREGRIRIGAWGPVSAVAVGIAVVVLIGVKLYSGAPSSKIPAGPTTAPAASTPLPIATTNAPIVTESPAVVPVPVSNVLPTARPTATTAPSAWASASSRKKEADIIRVSPFENTGTGAAGIPSAPLTPLPQPTTSAQEKPKDQKTLVMP